MRRLAPLSAALILAVTATPAFAQKAGDWTIGIGAYQIDPETDSDGTLTSSFTDFDIRNSKSFALTTEYFITDNLGVEVFASIPHKHDITVSNVIGVNGAYEAKVASTKLTLPSVTLQHHFGSGKVRPFIGAGVTYAHVGSLDTTGPLGNQTLELDNSIGASLRAGIDFDIGASGSVRIDARWADIESTAHVDNVPYSRKIVINPLVYGASYVYKF